MRKTAMLLGFLLLIGTSASACGVSPLLNHTQAPETREAAKVASSDCALQFPNAGLCASISWDAPPVENEEGSFRLRFWNKDATPSGPYVDPTSTVFVKLWMPGMGHGSSPVDVRREADGVYAVSRVYFMMGGHWQIRVQLKQSGKIVEEAIQDLTL